MSGDRENVPARRMSARLQGSAAGSPESSRPSTDRPGLFSLPSDAETRCFLSGRHPSGKTYSGAKPYVWRAKKGEMRWWSSADGIDGATWHSDKQRARRVRSRRDHLSISLSF